MADRGQVEVDRDSYQLSVDRNEKTGSKMKML
jgi:hypothetical protein